MNVWVGETRGFGRYCSYKFAVIMAHKIIIIVHVCTCMVCLKPPTKKRRNPKVEEDTVECSIDNNLIIVLHLMVDKKITDISIGSGSRGSHGL